MGRKKKQNDYVELLTHEDLIWVPLLIVIDFTKLDGSSEVGYLYTMEMYSDDITESIGGIVDMEPGSGFTNVHCLEDFKAKLRADGIPFIDLIDEDRVERVDYKKSAAKSILDEEEKPFVCESKTMWDEGAALHDAMAYFEDEIFFKSPIEAFPNDPYNKLKERRKKDEERELLYSLGAIP